MENRPDLFQSIKRAIPDLFCDTLERLVQFFNMACHIMPGYSIKNCILIDRQCPTATIVKCANDWHKCGRKIKNGETPIQILGPWQRRKARTVTRNGETFVEEATYMDYTIVNVYDISQTIKYKPSDVPIHRAYHYKEADFLKIIQKLLKGRGLALRIANIDTMMSCKNGILEIKKGMSHEKQCYAVLYGVVREMCQAYALDKGLSDKCRHFATVAITYIVAKAIELPVTPALELPTTNSANIPDTLDAIQAIAKELLTALNTL